MLEWRSNNARFYSEQKFASRLGLHDAVEGSVNSVTSNLEKILDNLEKLSSQFNPNQIFVRDFARADGEVVSDIEAVKRLLEACEAAIPLLEEESEIFTKLLSQAGGKDADASVARETQIRPSRPDNFVFQ